MTSATPAAAVIDRLSDAGITTVLIPNQNEPADS
jgi:hypothetical protein